MGQFSEAGPGSLGSPVAVSASHPRRTILSIPASLYSATISSMLRSSLSILKYLLCWGRISRSCHSGALSWGVDVNVDGNHFQRSVRLTEFYIKIVSADFRNRGRVCV